MMAKKRHHWLQSFLLGGLLWRLFHRRRRHHHNPLPGERTPEWIKASVAYKRRHSRCEYCGTLHNLVVYVGCLKALTTDSACNLREFMPTPFDSSGIFPRLAPTTHNLEAHDITPWHLLSNRQKSDYGWLVRHNLISLCHRHHHQLGHLNDSDWMKYNPHIREVAARRRRWF